MAKDNEHPVLLLVDDEPLIHRLLTFKLRNDGLEFISAFSGLEGLRIAQKNSPAMVIVDLNLPDVSGFEIIRRLKEDPATRNTPIIVISGSSESQDKVQAFDLGAMDYVAKPFDIAEMRARIRSALSLRRLMNMLEKRAQIDALTGLWNRAYFGERLRDELSRARRSGSNPCLVMCDLDHFKLCNDHYGHQAGDLVLQDFASMLTGMLRSCDVACRYGGEEFAIILPDTTLEAARSVCERIRQALERASWAAHPGMSVTVSMGIASLDPADVRDTSEWIQAADTALYRAKHLGRNRVCTLGDDAEREPGLRLVG